MERENKNMKRIYKTSSFILLIVLLTSLMLSGCGTASQKKTYTIGVVNLSTTFNSMLDGFKTGMTEAGYVEGQNVTYIYDGPVAGNDALKALLDSLKKKNVDLILTFGTTATIQAKQSLEGSNIPVVFGPVTDPVKSGIVTDLLKPGGNLTGIRTGNPVPKRLEWLMTVDPNIKRIYVINNPTDNSSIQGLAALKDTAANFNVDLVVHDASTPDEVSVAMSTLPDNVDAVFILASAFLESQLNPILKVANDHQLPVSAPSTENVRDGALTSFGQDNIPLGQQAARLADQILRGVKPADLPIENADLFMSINLKAANTIGLNVPDDVIRQANVVVR
jgi:putative tryptophan/tyrosine transport system substrate-binding protein